MEKLHIWGPVAPRTGDRGPVAPGSGDGSLSPSPWATGRRPGAGPLPVSSRGGAKRSMGPCRPGVGRQGGPVAHPWGDMPPGPYISPTQPLEAHLTPNFPRRREEGRGERKRRSPAGVLTRRGEEKGSGEACWSGDPTIGR
jgi:hypothetical protein